jgi:hypothetical protein
MGYGERMACNYRISNHGKRLSICYNRDNWEKRPIGLGEKVEPGLVVVELRRLGPK